MSSKPLAILFQIRNLRPTINHSRRTVKKWISGLDAIGEDQLKTILNKPKRNNLYDKARWVQVPPSHYGKRLGEFVGAICLWVLEKRLVTLSLSVMMLVLFWRKRRVLPWCVEPLTDCS